MEKIQSLIKLIRCIKYRFIGNIELGHKVKLGKAVSLKAKPSTKINIGNLTSLADYNYISCVKGCIKIGNNCNFNRNISIVAHKMITIGDNCNFGPGVIIYDHDHKFNENGLCPGYNISEVVIGNNCWIGANSIILRGTHIGDNTVIGAGSVVSGNVPDNTLVTSNRELKFKKLESR